jgi:hypothetical protein
MMTFWEWLGETGDEGYQAFLNQTNTEFRTWITAILQMGKFTDPRNETEAKAIVADPNYFNYAQELVAAAGGGRARLQGQDVLDGAQEANVELWRKLLDPRLYQAAGVTWESRNPYSAERGGIRGTIRSWARNKAGHFAARINKRRTGVTTRQISQIRDPDNPFDPAARPQMSELEWDDLKRAIINDLETQLEKEVASTGPHWQSRARNLRWAVEIVKRQMALPWQWRSTSEIMQEIPDLRAKVTNDRGEMQRGGLANQLKGIIDKARNKALGECSAHLVHSLDYLLLLDDGPFSADRRAALAIAAGWPSPEGMS